MAFRSNGWSVNNIAVIGAGAWGTALAIQAARAGGQVVLWARDPALAAALHKSRTSPRLPGAMLPESVHVTAILPTAAIIALAVPIAHLRSVATQLPGIGMLVACAKGMAAPDGALPLEILAELWPDRRLLVLTGPNFAHEVAAGLPAASVVAGGDAASRAAVITAFASPRFRLYDTDDAIGAPVGGAAKNVIAIAAGCVIGAGLGENARAALVTRGLSEIAGLAVAIGGQAATVSGLSGLGDLMLTCSGPSSRNMSLGLALGRGAPPDVALAGLSGTAEGAGTAAALVTRAGRLGIEVPICAAVAGLLEGRLDVAGAVTALLSRPLRVE